MHSLTRGGIRPDLLGKATIGFSAAYDGDLSVELTLTPAAPALDSSSLPTMGGQLSAR